MNIYLWLVCLVGAAGGFLFGFDTSVISGVVEYISSPNVYNLDEIAKGWAVSCIIIGCMVGCVFAGPFSSRFGRRTTLILTALIFLASSVGVCALAAQLFPFSYHLPHDALSIAVNSLHARTDLHCRTFPSPTPREIGFIKPVCYFPRTIHGLLLKFLSPQCRR